MAYNEEGPDGAQGVHHLKKGMKSEHGVAMSEGAYDHALHSLV